MSSVAEAFTVRSPSPSELNSSSSRMIACGLRQLNSTCAWQRISCSRWRLRTELHTKPISASRARLPETTPIQKFGNTRVSRAEPKAAKASNTRLLSSSIFDEPATRLAAAVCAANRLRELARIASTSLRISFHCSCDCCRAAWAAGLRTWAMPSSSLPCIRPVSTWVNTTESRASASPAALAPGPPARISVTRRAMVPATTTCCRALKTWAAGAPPAVMARTTSLSCACSCGTRPTKRSALPARASTASSDSMICWACCASGVQVRVSCCGGPDTPVPLLQPAHRGGDLGAGLAEGLECLGVAADRVTALVGELLREHLQVGRAGAGAGKPAALVGRHTGVGGENHHRQHQQDQPEPGADA